VNISYTVITLKFSNINIFFYLNPVNSCFCSSVDPVREEGSITKSLKYPQQRTACEH